MGSNLAASINVSCCSARLPVVVAPSLKDEHGHTILALSSGRLVDILLDNMDSALAAGTSKSGSGSNVSGSSSSGSGSAANAPPRVHLFR